jgi:glycosidase
MDRIAGAFILENNMRMAANLYLLAPGSPVIYYGEELGMRGSRGSEMTDANRRLAMLWGDDDHVRDPVGSTYPRDKQIQTTVADQLTDENSLYRYYGRLLAIRHRYPAIARGSYTAIKGDKNIGGFLIEYEGETLALIHNNSTGALTFDLSRLEGVEIGELKEFIGCGSASLEGTVLTLGSQTSALLG